MDIFVNVRPPTKDFTFYSFPSKLFEYLSLKKFVISTRLPSIPKDIDSSFSYFESTDPKHIANRIESIISENNYQSIESNFNNAYSHYSESGVSHKISSLIKSVL